MSGANELSISTVGRITSGAASSPEITHTVGGAVALAAWGRCRDAKGGGKLAPLLTRVGRGGRDVYLPPRQDALRPSWDPRKPPPIIVVRPTDKDFLGISQDHFIVVRPDRFILGIFKEDEADAFVAAFQRLLDRDR